MRNFRQRTSESLGNFKGKLGALKNNLWSFMTDACSGKACPTSNSEAPIRQSVVLKNEFVTEEMGEKQNEAEDYTIKINDQSSLGS